MVLKNSLPRLVFVLGGAASGKSAWAETLIQRSGLSRVYLATAQSFDTEMATRIAAHKNSRGPGWRTVEAPLDPGPALSGVRAGEAVLLDCATLWLSNHLLAGSDLEVQQALLLDALAGCAAPVVVVSNEVGHGIVPDNPLARRFREAQGRLNIALAARADLAVLVIAGLPQVLKGELP